MTTMTSPRMAAIVRAVQSQSSMLVTMEQLVEGDPAREAAIRTERELLASGLVVMFERFPEQAAQLSINDMGGGGPEWVGSGL